MKEKSEMDNLFISEFQYTEECIPEYLKRWWRENLIISYILTALVFLYFLLMLIIRRNLVYLVLEILPVLLLLLIRAKVSRAIKVEKERYQVNYGNTALDLVSGPVTTRLTDIQVSRSQAQRQRSLSMLAAMPQRNRIYPAYCSGMQELLTGQMFVRTYEGLTDARQKVAGKQGDIMGLLEDCERRIQSANSSMAYWKARLQETLAAEMKQAEEENV